MLSVKRNLLLVLVLLGSWLGSWLIRPSLVYAQEAQFETTLESTYQVEDSGLTTVNHHFKIKNLTPTTFVKQYGLKLSSTRLEDIVVKSGSETIDPEIVTTQNQTSIGISFPDEIVGQGKIRDFTISYHDPDLAQVSGQVLEVSIPSTNNQAEAFDQQSILINTPIRYGLPSRVSNPDYQTQLVNQNGANLIQTTVNQPGAEGISLLFGEQQVFNLTLKYHLENPYSNPRLIQIALPPDTSYQTVAYQDLSPQPTQIEKDADGNWIATYKLEANSATTVTANLLTKITLDPNPDFPVLAPDKSYLQAQKYWPVNDPQIQGLASSLGGIEAVYHNVVETLNYDYETVDQKSERLGASQALNKPDQAHCEEFTDLFVTLARAENTPARRLAGYAYTQNDILRPLDLVQDVLHAWPEYWDEANQRWIQVDPTWEKTSGGIDYFHQFDLNHIVFAINGESSTLPYPAGSYSLDKSPGKNISVEFADTFTSVAPEFKIGIEQKKLAFFTLPESTYLTIYNPTGQAFYNKELALTVANPQDQLSGENPVIDSILPFETKKIKIKVSSSQVLPQATILTVKHDQQTFDLYVTPESELYQQLSQPYIILGVGAAAILLALGSGSLLVWRSRRQRALRGKSKKSRQKTK